MGVLFFDTETTSKEENARLVQLAFKTYEDTKIKSDYFNSGVPIELEAMAIHDITNEFIKGRQSFVNSAFEAKFKGYLQKGLIPVAHNAKFDVNIMKNEGILIGRYICTYKVARDVLPELPSHKLNFLRHYYRIDLSDKGYKLHDASTDVLILDRVFKYLLVEVASKYGLTDNKVLEKMIDISINPVRLQKLSFGKYKGILLDEVATTDMGYLRWLKSQENLDEDLKHTLFFYN